MQRTSPEQQGIASAAVLQLIEALDRQIHELHSFMLLRHGSVVAEGWWSPYRREYPHRVFSLSKSFTATAVGLALAEGRFAIDDMVLPFFADDAPTEVSDYLAAMSVRHLLSMATGHAVDTWAYMVDRPDGNWIKGFFEVPVLHTPGSHFLYNTGATYILSAIVQKTTGLKVIDYLQPRLFEPLDIENAAWDESPQGINMGGIGLNIKTEDIACFGQLYLQNGLWQGKQILPEAWVAEATTIQIANGEIAESDWAQGYGYQFWRCRHGAYRGDGVFGQYCIIMPKQDAVLAITGGVDLFDMQQPLDLVWELLLPAMGMEPLAEDAVAHQRLAEKLASLSLPPAQGQKTAPVVAQVSGQTYTVDENELKIETLTLNFADAGCTIGVKSAAGVETIVCGYGTWQPSQTAIFNEFSAPEPIVSSGAWTDDSLTLVIRRHETPFFHTWILHFDGAEILIETQVNVSFEPTKMLLTAQAV